MLYSYVCGYDYKSPLMSVGAQASLFLHALSDFDVKHFWKWSRFRDYTQFLMAFTVTMMMLTALLFEFKVYVETLGFVSLVTEAMLGLPQFYHNFTNKSTAGMR